MATTYGSRYVFPTCAERRHLGCPGTFAVGTVVDSCSCVCHAAERSATTYAPTARPLERWGNR
jgi:hypothetical protein